MGIFLTQGMNHSHADQFSIKICDSVGVLIQITLGDDSQCTDIIVYLTNTDLGDDSQCTRGKAVQLQIKYLSR